MKKWLLVLALVTGVVVPVSAQAPEFPKPGPEHAMLKKMEGTWDCVIKGMGAESKGKMIYKMELGDLWLVGNFEGDVFGSKFTGKGMDTYDGLKKKYVSVWCDSMSTTPVLLEGTYDKAKKTLTQTGSGPGPDGKPATYKSITVYKSDDEINFSMNLVVEGKDVPMIAIDYKRKK